MSAARSTAGASRIQGVDLLRSVAVALVIMSHAGAKGFAGYGVPFLIVLSSFLVSRIYDGASAPRNFKDHFLRRFLRIAPAYYAYLVFTLAADFLLGSRWSLIEALTAFTHTVNIDNAFSRHTHPIAHVWTLSILEQFYLLSFLLYPVLLGISKRKLLVVCIACVLAISVLRAVIYMNVDDARYIIYNSLILRLDMFLLGVLLTRYYSELMQLAESPVFGAASFVVGAVVISVSITVPVFHYSFGFAVEAAAAALMIVGVHSLSRATGLLEHRALTRLAAYSYSAYLFQMWGLAVAEEFTSLPLLKGLMGVVVSFMCGAVVHRVVEAPFLKLRVKLLTKPLRNTGGDAAQLVGGKQP